MNGQKTVYNKRESSKRDTIRLDDATNLILKASGYDLRPFADEYTRARLNRHLLPPHHAPSPSTSPHSQITQLSRQDVISALSLNVTTMFRDPLFYCTLRREVLPALNARKHLRIWEVGCATGEESYSLAITLNELGFANRYTIVATDFNASAIESARRGKYNIKKARAFTHNYHRADGQYSFSDYYSATSEFLIVSPELRRNIFFREADVTKEGIDFRPDLIVCRNVIFYFSRRQQIETLELLSGSLNDGGFLCIGSKEPLPAHALKFEMREISEGGRIFAVQAQDRAKPGLCHRGNLRSLTLTDQPRRNQE